MQKKNEKQRKQGKREQGKQGQNTKKKHIQILSKFWSKIGSKIIFMNSKEHDHIFSITSHLPHLVAYNMVKTAMNFESKFSKLVF